MQWETEQKFWSKTEQLNANFHSCFKSWMRNELDTLPSSDSLLPKPKSSAIPFTQSPFIAQPLFRTLVAHDGANDTTVFLRGIGASATYVIPKKFAVNLNWYTENSAQLSYFGKLSDSLHAYPGLDYATPTQEGISSTRIGGYVSWYPHRFFHLQAGVGRNFWGDGYRSLLLSDNAANYPYFRFTTGFWRIKYAVLYSAMKDIHVDPINRKDFFRKFSTSHFLNWNIGRRVSLGVFESVIWQAKDTMLNRGFDVHYLNPFVFFRPLEYEQGSSDNVIMGLNLKVKIIDGISVYSQFLLDEFLMKEVRADSGWWANKYGYQLGIKFAEPFGFKGFNARMEYNVVRPFTYSHGSVLQNYGHSNLPLAHPLGANFKEFVAQASYSFKQFALDVHVVNYVYGADSSNASFGGNIYQSYANRTQDYGNTIAQGRKMDVYYHCLRFSWIPVPQWNLRLFVSHVYRKSTVNQVSSTENYLMAGLSAWIWNSYTDR